LEVDAVSRMRVVTVLRLVRRVPHEHVKIELAAAIAWTPHGGLVLAMLYVPNKFYDKDGRVTDISGAIGKVYGGTSAESISEKWIPVFGKRPCSTDYAEPRCRRALRRC
jgi:hypothetical protein